MAGRHLFVFSLFPLLLFLRFVFVCCPLSMSNSLRAKSSGLYFSRDCPASFDVFVRLWLLFLLYSPIPPPSGVLVILCFHDLMYQHQKISFWNVYPPFCGLRHRFWIFICFKVRIFVFLCLVDLSKVVRMLPCVLCASWNGVEVRWQNMEGKKIFSFFWSNSVFIMQKCQWYRSSVCSWDRDALHSFSLSCFLSFWFVVLFFWISLATGLPSTTRVAHFPHRALGEGGPVGIQTPNVQLCSQNLSH